RNVTGVQTCALPISLYQIGLRALPQLRTLLDGAFLEIVVLGGEPEILVLQFRELSLDPDDRLLRGLDQRPGFRTHRLLGRLRLLWLLVHGLALHEQSVCRRRCAVLAGPSRVCVGNWRSGKKIAAKIGPVERA